MNTAISQPIHVTHIITDLDTGGAEMMLYRLLGELDSCGFPSQVISLTSEGTIGVKILSLGIPVRSLGMHPAWPSLISLFRLAKWLHEDKQHPSIVQTWMYHADLVGGMAARLAGGGVPVVWGLHNSTLDRKTSKWTTRLVVRMLALLSGSLPERIISCSGAARQLHVRLGYPDKKIVVIPNGFDTDLYKPDPEARNAARQALGIDPGTELIGIVARFDPQKDHRNFIEAARLLHQEMPGVHFVLIGGGMDQQNTALKNWLSELSPVCHLLGLRDDIPMWMASFDLFSLSSAYGEAFPLVVGEAMACGVPCIATDVGDTATLISNFGQVVPPRDPDALAHAWQRWLELPSADRKSVGLQARQHIIDNYSIERITQDYIRLYRQVLNSRPQA